MWPALRSRNSATMGLKKLNRNNMLPNVSFRFDVTKATEVAGQFLRKEGGLINIMKLVKLVYLLDRSSVARRGVPVVGGAYFSLPNGPITSEFLDLINSGCLWGLQ